MLARRVGRQLLRFGSFFWDLQLETTKSDGWSMIILSDLQHNLDTGLSWAISHSKKAPDLENILVLV